MAIKDYTNFDYNIEQLIKPIDLEIKKQNKVLDSDKFNSSLLSIEKNLDVLYEKTRYLEDSIDYARSFLDQKITSYSNRINTIISSVSDISNINKNMSYLDYAIPFKENTVNSTDRDPNYSVKPCSINGTDKVLTLSNNVSQAYDINSIARTCQQIPYDSNINDLKNGDKYRVLYIEDKPFTDGAIETFTCYLPYASEVNYVKIGGVNCSVENITLVYPNGVTELIDPMTGINTESRMATHVRYNIKCTAYDTVEYILDEELANADNIWNELKEYEYALSVDKDTKLEVEALIKRTSTSADGKVTTKTYKAAPEKTTTITKYIYVFGIDNIVIGLLDFNKDCYFTSETINTGKLQDGDYLQLHVVDNTGEFSSIEYYIVDGDMEIPVLPVSDKLVYNEKVFPEEDLRFEVDDDLFSLGIINVKRDGMGIDTTYDDIKNQYDAKYCVSYQPKNDCYNYTPINDSIKVKAIMRIYGSTIDTIPYIKSINVRKYGGTTLWTKLY